MSLDCIAQRQRQRQLAAVRQAWPVIARWSARLSSQAPSQAEQLRAYLHVLANVEAGLWRAVRDGRVGDAQVVLLVDEYAETRCVARRPSLPESLERRIGREIADAVRLSADAR